MSKVIHYPRNTVLPDLPNTALVVVQRRVGSTSDSVFKRTKNGQVQYKTLRRDADEHIANLNKSEKIHVVMVTGYHQNTDDTAKHEKFQRNLDAMWDKLGVSKHNRI